MITFILFLFYTSYSFAGGGHGGVSDGGSIVSENFFTIGNEIVDDLEIKKDVQDAMAPFHLDSKALRAVLTPEVVKTVKTESHHPLVDRLGSVVAALGVKGSVILDSDAWLSIFLRYNARRMVFHEMLRGAGYDDDGAVISSHLPMMGSEVSHYETIQSIFEEAGREVSSDLANAFSETKGRLYTCDFHFPYRGPFSIKFSYETDAVFRKDSPQSTLLVSSVTWNRSHFPGVAYKPYFYSLPETNEVVFGNLLPFVLVRTLSDREIIIQTMADSQYLGKNTDYAYQVCYAQ